MQLSLQNFSTLMQNMAASAQGAASQLLDLTVGSTLRAIFEANASVALWIQWLIVQVLQTTRAATSTGSDLDSWMADMTLTRLPAVAASGLVTFSRYAAIAPASIPPGTLVRTADGSVVFVVLADSTNPAWDPATGCYLLPAGISSVQVSVVAQEPGSGGNVQAGTISLIATAVPGVDNVSNPAAFTNGADAESDNAFRSRFQNFLGTRSRATPAAVGFAISGLQQGLSYLIQENVDEVGNVRMGNFVITVDDGSGNPPSSLLSAVTQAVEPIRPIGSSFSVRPPTVVVADVTLTITAGPQKPTLMPTIISDIETFINQLPIGAPLSLTRIAQIAYNSSGNISNVNTILINGSSADLLPPAVGVVKAGMVTVN